MITDRSFETMPFQWKASISFNGNLNGSKKLDILIWSGQLFPSPGDLPNPGLEPQSPALQVDSLPSETPHKPPGATLTSLLFLWLFSGLIHTEGNTASNELLERRALCRALLADSGHDLGCGYSSCFYQ